MAEKEGHLEAGLELGAGNTGGNVVVMVMVQVRLDQASQNRQRSRIGIDRGGGERPVNGQWKGRT